MSASHRIRAGLGLHRAWLAAFAAAFTLLSGAAAAQGNSIDQITVSKGSSGNTIVRFQMKTPPQNPPAGFSIANPPRIALDFLDTTNAMGATQRTLDDPALRSYNVIQSGSRTRVVFNLNKAQTFQTSVEGNAVLVTLMDQGDAQDARTQVVQRFAEARPGDAQHALRDVDFRRGRNGEGRIVVDLSDNSTGIDIQQQGQRLIVDFIKTTLPRNLQRRLDVQDFGTPVVSVDTFVAGLEHADGRRAQGPVGALRLPVRQPLHPRGEADPRGSEQADAGHAAGLQGREALAQLPERGGALRAAGDRRLHRAQHHHQRHRPGQPHAAPQGHPVGPGAGHHPADQGPRHAQERQCRARRPARGAGPQGEAAARERRADQPARAAAARVVPAQLHEGERLRQHAVDQPPAELRRRRGPDGDHRRAGVDPVAARRRLRGPAVQHPVRAGHRRPSSRRCAASSASSTCRSGRC